MAGGDGGAAGWFIAPASREMRAPGRRSVRLERAIIGGGLATVTAHPNYVAAKAGDIAAAVRLARDLVSDDLVAQVRAALGNSRPLIVPVVSEEAAGRNKIPRAAAEMLARRLGLETAEDIVQANAPRRTAMGGLDRIFASARIGPRPKRRPP